MSSGVSTQVTSLQGQRAKHSHKRKSLSCCSQAKECQTVSSAIIPVVNVKKQWLERTLSELVEQDKAKELTSMVKYISIN